MEIYFKRQTVISFPDNPSLDDITTGIADGSLMIDEVLFTDRFTVGTCNSNRFECDLYDFDTIGNEKIYVYQNVWDSAEDITPTEEPLFTGYVDSCITNRGRLEDSKHIVAYDSLQKYANVDVAAWWEECFNNSVTRTVKYLRDSLCTFVGITYENVSLPNDSVLISQTQQINKISFLSMLTYIMQINASNATVDRSGTLRFITLSDNDPIAIDETYAQNTSEFDDYVIPEFITVRITNSTENTVAVSGGETNYLDITDNVLLLNKNTEELQSIADTIRTNVNEITYYPATIDMIVSDLSIQVGDIVTIGNKQFIVCEQTIYGSQFVDHTISSVGQNTLEDSTGEYDATQRDIQSKLGATALKYYRFQNKVAIVLNNSAKPIINIRYSCAEDGVIVFHGTVIFDLERISTSSPAQVVFTYKVFDETIREFTPTEYYYHDGRYTFNLLYFWEALGNVTDNFIVTLTPTNCKITIGAFKEAGYMEGMGLIGENVWDGYIECEDNVIRIDDLITTPSSIDPIEEEVEVELIEPVEIDGTDNVILTDLATVPEAIDKYEDDLVNIGGDGWLHDDLTWGEVAELYWQDLYDERVW